MTTHAPRALATLTILVLTACAAGAAPSGEPSPDVKESANPTDLPATASPIPKATITAEPTPTPTGTPSEPDATGTANPSPSPTAGPFGADVFSDPDDCAHPSGAYRVAFPDAWWWNTGFENAETGRVAACRLFAPSFFDVSSVTRRSPIPAGVSVWLDYLEGGCFGYINPILEERDVEVDGFTATVREFAQGKRRDNPPSYYRYTIELTPDLPCESPDSQTIVATTGVDLFGSYQDNKDMLDRMMRTMEIEIP